MTARKRADELVRAFQASLVGRLIARYTGDQGWFLGAAVAYNALFSMLPIIVLVVTLLGLAFRDPTTYEKAVLVVADVLPPEASSPILDVIQTSTSVTDVWGLISLAGLIWIGLGFFTALEEALDRVYTVRERTLVAQRLMGLAMIAIFAVLIVLQIAAASVAQLVVQFAALVPLVHSSLTLFIPIIGYFVSVVAAFLLCFAVLYVVPNLRLSLRETLPGTLFATATLAILAQGFPLYARISGGAGKYGQVFGLALLLMTWSYFVAHAFIVGAELNVVLRTRREQRLAGEGGGRSERPRRGRARRAIAGRVGRRGGVPTPVAARRGRASSGRVGCRDRRSDPRTLGAPVRSVRSAFLVGAGRKC